MESISSTSIFFPRIPLHPSPSFFLNSTFHTSLPSSSSSFKRAKLGFSNHGARRFPVICGADNAGSSFVTEIDKNQFSDVVLKSDRPVLVEFVATWCGPCRLISPVLEQVAKEYKDQVTIVKIDHDASPELIKEYKVFGLPAFILFKDGQEIPGSKTEGAMSKKKLKDYLKSFLESASVA